MATVMAETGVQPAPFSSFNASLNPMASDAVGSITGVASAGFRLSMILNAVSCEVANAPFELHTISRNVTLFAMLLKQASVVLQRADSVHSDEAVRTGKQIAEESNQVFNQINEMIEHVRSGSANGASSATIQQRFKTYFNKKKIDYLLAHLESLKLSLSLMLQIIQLGKLMASTSKNDPPERVDFMVSAIRQERMEAQNTVVNDYFQREEVNRLFEGAVAARQEVHSPIEYRNTSSDEDEEKSVTTNGSSQLTIEAPLVSSPSTELTRLSLHSLSEGDDGIDQMKASAKDMVQVSDRRIDPLLEKWTRWREIRERRQTRGATSNGRFNPAVHSTYEDDDDIPYFARYRERENSPRGFYLEGSTTDWRKPHSVSAREQAAKLRKVYAGLQPSVSAANSDVEDSPESTMSKGRAPRHRVLDSSSESDDSDTQHKDFTHRRQSGGNSSYPAPRKDGSTEDGTPLSKSFSATPSTSTQSKNSAPPGNNRNPSAPLWGPPLPRPYPTPDQSMPHHSFSSPLPPVHTHNAPYPYPSYTTAPSPGAPGTSAPSSQYFPNHLYPQGRYAPPPGVRIPSSGRPVSRDGKPPRSPSRLSQGPNPPAGRQRTAEEEKKASRKETRKKLGEGARNGLLAGGGIAVFLEALESLSI